MGSVNYLVLKNEKLAFEIHRDVSEDDVNEMMNHLDKLRELVDFEYTMDKPLNELNLQDITHVLSIYFEASYLNWHVVDICLCAYFKDHEFEIVGEYTFNEWPDKKDYKMIYRNFEPKLPSRPDIERV